MESGDGRRRLSAVERRQQLVDIGGQLLISVPLEEVTMQRVAQAAGVSRTLVFHYFPTVRALHLACLERAAADLLDSLVVAAMAADDANRIRSGLEAFVDYITQQPKTFLAMAAYAGAEPEFGEVFSDVRDQIVDLICELEGVKGDELGRVMLHGWVAMSEASVTRWLRGAEIDRSELTDELHYIRAQIHERLSARMGAVTP